MSECCAFAPALVLMGYQPVMGLDQLRWYSQAAAVSSQMLPPLQIAIVGRVSVAAYTFPARIFFPLTATRVTAGRSFLLQARLLDCPPTQQLPRTSPKRYSCRPHTPTAFMMDALWTTRTGMPARRARSSRSVCVVALKEICHQAI